MTDREASEMEVKAALQFWSQFHTSGARNRVRAAIRYFRKYR
jgi:hypothetical protein